MTNSVQNATVDAPGCPRTRVERVELAARSVHRHPKRCTTDFAHDSERTILCASYDEPPTFISAGRWEFFGDFVLRAQPASEPPPAGMRRVEQMMRQAPLVLTVQKATVLIENVER